VRRAEPSTTEVDLTTVLGSLTLPNPVLTASGTAGFGAELAAFVDLSRLGATVTKSLSVHAWAGNPAPRLYPLGTGMLNSVGLQNPGVAGWRARYLPDLAATGARIVVSIWGSSVEGYRAAASEVAQAAVAGGGAAGGGAAGGGAAGRIVAVEANISCPNIEDRERMFAHSQAGTAAAVAAAAAGLDGSGLPLWAKLSPNVTDLPAIAGAALDAGADALTLVNTLMGLAIDPVTGRARLGGGGGGLSGPALHSVAVRAVFECRRAHPDAPIVGVGGISTGIEAAEMIAAGADAIGVGTASFANPRAVARVLDELRSWCAAHDVHHLRQLRGRAHA
jgi:dihydroorotate dehydrogenase (NAD+) catalytic subunit